LVISWYSFLLYFIFIPFFNKKNRKYYDGFLLTWTYLIIIIVISFRTNDFDEYDYFFGFTLIIGLPFISELVLKSTRKNYIRGNIDLKSDVLKNFKTKNEFTILEITSSLNISEYKARKILNNMVKEGKIELKKAAIKITIK